MQKQIKNPLMVLPLYRKDQWETLRATGESIDDTWEQWNAQGEEIIAKIKAKGIPYLKIPVDVDELNQYCKEQGFANNPESRCKFLEFKKSGRKQDEYFVKVSEDTGEVTYLKNDGPLVAAGSLREMLESIEEED